MGDRKQPSQDLRIHNVSLHRRGKAEYGTLSLTKHHLTFTFTPDAQKDSATEKKRTASAQHATPNSSEDSKTTSEPNASVNDAPKSPAPATAGDTPSKSQPVRSKARPKTIWIAYPMINYCVLRPSHLQGVTNRAPVPEPEPKNTDDDLFPPTYGTSSYSNRPSTDSARLTTPYSSPRRTASPAPGTAATPVFNESGRPPAIRIRCRDFQMMAFHFHASSGTSPDNSAREIFFSLRSRCCVKRVEDMLAFHFQCPKEELEAGTPIYDARREFARMGISEKAPAGPGSAWRISDINADYAFSSTYPSVLCVPQSVSDNMLKYGGIFRSRYRIPSLAYLHFNGGSITRSSQPMVGITGKRNPQDERLVCAIFSSHTPPLVSPEDSPRPSMTAPQADLNIDPNGATSIDSDAPVMIMSQGETELDEKPVEVAPPPPKTYGSTRYNFIVDARPRINAEANRTGGGGVEDVTNYMTSGDLPVEKVFLGIQNIHVMRSSLEKVIDSFANSDYLDLPPNQETLRKSGWLGHVQTLLEGSDMVARKVGLGASHVLVHCSDGWDRTSQVSALAQLMLDPYYRTLVGFITLIQKDFLSYGHKFKDRNGIQGSEKWFEIENERIVPSKNREDAGGDGTSLNVLGTKALTGAKNWFEKNRGTLFRQQNASRENLGDNLNPPSTPPPNPIIHTTPSSSSKEDKEHKTKTDEIAPIFHHFLDAVYQLQRQNPSAFEFNERFLLRLLYQTYSGQYGEFLFNTEKDRLQGSSKTPSVWAHFLARRSEFTNPDFIAKPDEALFLPNKGADQRIDVRWWSNLFKRTDQEMNVPRALAPADPATLTAQNSSLSLNEGDGSGNESNDPGTYGFALKNAKSTPAKESLVSNFNKLSTQSNTKQASTESTAITPSTQATPMQSTADQGIPLNNTAESETKPQVPEINTDDNDDPLGVTSSMQRQQGGLDFSAFASQNAFQDR